MSELAKDYRSKQLGKLWLVGADGSISNDASKEKIAKTYSAAIDAVVATYSTHAGSCLHSVYLRGSVARGMALPGISDLDTFGVLHCSADIDINLWPENAKSKILRTCPQLADVQLELFCLSDALKIDEVQELPFVIKTQSVCVYGEDLTDRLPNYRPGVAVANIDIVQIEADLEEAITYTSSPNADAADVRYWCSRIMKNILRAGFSLTMVDEKSYTRDLMICAETFSRHYPVQADNMNRALKYVFDPEPDQAELERFLRDFGCWIAHEASVWLAIHNPARSTGIRQL